MEKLSQSKWSEEATLEDIYYCYRLLLGREPDEAGLKFWTERLSTENFSYGKLAAYFSKSKEYLTNPQARGLKIIKFPDFDLFVNQYDWDVGEQMIRTGGYEPHVTAFLKEHLQTGMTFVDVGANVGYFTLLGATLVGPGGRTIAIECNSKNCELIYLSLGRNRFDRVLVYTFALSDSQKLMKFNVGFSNGAVSELDSNTGELMIVPAVTLDYLMRNESRLDIIKMDIEGSEAKAWQGMQETIRRYHPTILMEFFPTLLRTNSEIQPDEFLESILAQGYTATILDPNRAETSQATSASAVMAAWEERRELVGDESKTFLDLAFQIAVGR